MKLHLQFLLASLLIFVLHCPANAAKRSYVVYLGGHSNGPDVSEAQLYRVTETHHELLGSHIGSIEKAKDAIFYSYSKHINGFAAMLEKEEAESLSRDPRVVSIFLNKGKQLHTTRSWDFLGLGSNGNIPSQSLWKKAKFGEGVIVGTLDTGVWPESQSFHDAGLGPIPSRWKGGCQDNTKSGVPCNKKLIGVKYFNEGYKVYAAEENVTLDSSVDSTHDVEGHGSHTLSTIAGLGDPTIMFRMIKNSKDSDLAKFQGAVGPMLVARDFQGLKFCAFRRKDLIAFVLYVLGLICDLDKYLIS